MCLSAEHAGQVSERASDGGALSLPTEWGDTGRLGGQAVRIEGMVRS